MLDWSHPGAASKIDWNGTKPTVTTHPLAWNYGAVSSITFPKERPIRPGVVRVLFTVKESNAGIGFTGSNISNFIKRVEILPKNGPQEVYFEFDNLGELHHFIISTWDKDKSAKVEILEFSVRDIPRSEQ